MCEKCWGDAFLRSYGGGDQVKAYMELIEERKPHQCTLKQQAGQWWDEEKQIDSRELETKQHP